MPARDLLTTVCYQDEMLRSAVRPWAGVVVLGLGYFNRIQKLGFHRRGAMMSFSSCFYKCLKHLCVIQTKLIQMNIDGE